MMQSPGPAAAPMTEPKAVGWARTYALAFTLMYGLCALGGVLLVGLGATGHVTQSHHRDGGEQIVQGVIMTVMGIGLAILSGMTWKRTDQRTKSAWMFHMVLQAIGLTSCCCIPFALPLLLQWNKPEVKQWYGA